MGGISSRQTMLCLTCSVGRLVPRESVVSKCPQCVLLGFALLCLNSWMISPPELTVDSIPISSSIHLKYTHTGRTPRHPHHRLRPQGLCSVLITWAHGDASYQERTCPLPPCSSWCGLSDIHLRQSNQCSTCMVSPAPLWLVQGTVWPKLSYLHQAFHIVFPWSKSSISLSSEFLECQRARGDLRTLTIPWSLALGLDSYESSVVVMGPKVSN